ncbi:allograft inflammatory factor 1 [Apostichopus japonicus]|uniref:Allograft inflammatory factor 1 n=1 Tax=Stichopus japonicus TaxID=307972 RepID=A0A2G8KYU0_STIJA|nr:allograft inflammatory factor 1 [Apostichopus japonicus]
MGGKQWGRLKEEQNVRLTEINEQVVANGDYKEYDPEELEEKLVAFKDQFMEYDLDNSDDLDVTDVSKMMEKLGKPKNIIEVRKIIAEVDTNNSGTIGYNEFLQMMLGKKSSVLKLILMFEEKGKGCAKPDGIAPKRSLEEMLNKPNI